VDVVKLSNRTLPISSSVCSATIPPIRYGPAATQEVTNFLDVVDMSNVSLAALIGDEPHVLLADENVHVWPVKEDPLRSTNLLKLTTASVGLRAACVAGGVDEGLIDSTM
jgi:hypothetical protein